VMNCGVPCRLKIKRDRVIELQLPIIKLTACHALQMQMQMQHQCGHDPPSSTWAGEYLADQLANILCTCTRLFLESVCAARMQDQFVCDKRWAYSSPSIHERPSKLPIHMVAVKGDDGLRVIHMHHRGHVKSSALNSDLAQVLVGLRLDLNNSTKL